MGCIILLKTVESVSAGVDYEQIFTFSFFFSPSGLFACFPLKPTKYFVPF